MTDPCFVVRPERAEDLTALKNLAARSFGPGRFARTAHRVRESASPVECLGLTAWVEDELAGSIRFTAITIGECPGALLLGPLMVDTGWTGQGCGKALMTRGLDLAREAGEQLVLLVGDLPYYERVGFQCVPPGQIIMPGPVDFARLLAAELNPGALNEFGGLVRATEL
ncbi:MAG: GNAT family N-acetyltransferase [Alphaproteobacteria bacterium]